MNKGENFGIGMRLDRLRYLLGVDRITPPILHHYRSTAAALDIFFHSPAKDTVLADNSLVTWL